MQRGFICGMSRLALFMRRFRSLGHFGGHVAVDPSFSFSDQNDAVRGVFYQIIRFNIMHKTPSGCRVPQIPEMPRALEDLLIF
jgi:hypothetical protein